MPGWLLVGFRLDASIEERAEALESIGATLAPGFTMDRRFVYVRVAVGGEEERATKAKEHPAIADAAPRDT